MPTQFLRQQSMAAGRQQSMAAGMICRERGKGSSLDESQGIYRTHGLGLLWLLLCTFIYSGIKQKVSSLEIFSRPWAWGAHSLAPAELPGLAIFHILFGNTACAAVILKQSFQQTVCIDLLLPGMEMSYLHPCVLLYLCNCISKNGCFLIVHSG